MGGCWIIGRLPGNPGGLRCRPGLLVPILWASAAPKGAKQSAVSARSKCTRFMVLPFLREQGFSGSGPLPKPRLRSARLRLGKSEGQKGA